MQILDISSIGFLGMDIYCRVHYLLISRPDYPTDSEPTKKKRTEIKPKK